MAGTKIGIPKFTGQETDVSDKANDWLTGLETYFTEKGVADADNDWARRCGLIRWSLVFDSTPESKDSTSASPGSRQTWRMTNQEVGLSPPTRTSRRSSRSDGLQGHR